MPRRILDTNILIDHFRGLRPYAEKRPEDATAWAKELIKNRDADAILSPIEVEFLVGGVDRHEILMAEAYLSGFRVVDEHKTLAQDWEEARRLAKHVGHHAKPRDLGDCLIDAISNRLKYVVVTNDQGLRRQHGRTRQRRP